MTPKTPKQAITDLIEAVMSDMDGCLINFQHTAIDEFDIMTAMGYQLDLLTGQYYRQAEFGE